MYQVSALGSLAAFGVALVAGVVGAIIAGLIGGLSLFALLYAPAIGPTLGKFIVRASGGKRGTKVALIASAGFLAGALGAAIGPMLSLLAPGVNRPALPLASVLSLAVVSHPFVWLMVAIAVASLWVFLK